VNIKRLNINTVFRDIAKKFILEYIMIAEKAI
jgi:hypothetical protein